MGLKQLTIEMMVADRRWFEAGEWRERVLRPFESFLQVVILRAMDGVGS